MKDHLEGGMLNRLLYISRASPSLRADFQWEIEQIAQSADAANRQHGITGILMGYDGWFVQALEGAEPNLTHLYNRIKLDRRHEQITLVSVERIKERQFSEWGMKAGRLPDAGASIQLDTLSTQDLVIMLEGALGIENDSSLDILASLTVIDMLLI